MGRSGQISVNTQDILPIIKKWLYSEHDIFLRELVANASDAITKRATLSRGMNVELPAGRVRVFIDRDKKTLQVIDNGLGMNEEEIEKYIATLAFSGAKDFVEKMKDEGAEGGKDIIGKFGLGFYSAFMVADKVEVDTLSMHEGSKAVKWISEGQEEYEIADGTRTEIGTTITLHINEESAKFLDKWTTHQTLKNHCDFMPYPIELVEEGEKEKHEEEMKKAQEEDKKSDTPEWSPMVVNDTEPLWKKDPSSLKDEDYKDFFRKLFPMEREPLFWIHLNVDHPFHLQGILFFPKINRDNPLKEQNIRLYCKQVFVSDNVKNVIPDFLGLLKGTIDSTDIPLNVSRSSLQGDPNIQKISNYVVKKVAEALKKLFKKDRERYEEIWEDLSLFVKYGCISDTKFDELMRSMVIYKGSDGSHLTLNEYKESVPADYKEKMADKVIYFEKEKSDNSLRKQLWTEKIHAIETDEYIDPHFMQHAEMKKIGDDQVQFVSVDSEIENLFTEENTTEEGVKIKELFETLLLPKTEKKDDNPLAGDLSIEVKGLKNSPTPAYYKVDEQMKRMHQMTKSMGGGANLPMKKTLIINPQNPLIQNTFRLHESGKSEELVKRMAMYVQDLATISTEGLKAEQKDEFVTRSQTLLQELSEMVLQ